MKTVYAVVEIYEHMGCAWAFKIYNLVAVFRHEITKHTI